MYRFIVLSLLSCVLVQGDVDRMENCGRFIHPKGISCCTKKYISAKVVEDLKECMLIPVSPPSCEREICMAKKNGFGSDDGTIDKTKLKAFFEKDGGDNIGLQKALMEDCVDGDLSDYGPPDFCDLMKLNTCFLLHLVADCPGWSDEGHCSGSAEAAEQCIKSLA